MFSNLMGIPSSILDTVYWMKSFTKLSLCSFEAIQCLLIMNVERGAELGRSREIEKKLSRKLLQIKKFKLKKI